LRELQELRQRLEALLREQLAWQLRNELLFWMPKHREPATQLFSRDLQEQLLKKDLRLIVWLDFMLRTVLHLRILKLSDSLTPLQPNEQQGSQLRKLLNLQLLKQLDLIT